MNKTWTIFKRELLTRVKTRGFVIGTFISPLFLLLVVLLPTLLMQHGAEAVSTIAVADFTGRLVEPMQGWAKEYKKDAGGNALYTITSVEADSAGIDSLKRRMNDEILTGHINVFLILPADIFTKNGFELYARNLGNFELNYSINEMLTKSVSQIRLAGSGLDPSHMEALTHEVSAATFKVVKGGAKEESGEAAFYLSYIMVFLLYMVLVFYGTFVMRGVIEDKQSRVVEVMLSSARPFQIMAGKILGIGAAGLIQMAVWAVCILAVTAYGATFAAAADFSLPSVSLWTLAAFLLFFLIGYFLYSATYAAMGSMGNTEAEMQALQWPALAPLIFSLVVMMMVVRNPEGTAAVVLSMIPFFSPMLMFLRISMNAAPLGQVVVCIGLCLLTIAGMIWLSSRIFRVGILMVGKRPTLPEVLKWIRQD